MRLRRIEAVRFGKIDGLSLGDLSPRLTVVHGPNESGKSSLTALVRYVLYGFPSAGRRPEAPYSSGSGKRLGRLVFAGAGGEWVVERADGPHGGTAIVSTLSGAQRPGLVGEITAAVPGGAYRIVYGFGLADMQDIADLKSQDENLFAKFYAASAGLEVDPGVVRAGIESTMSDLWKKGGSAPELNRLKSERERARAEIRALEAEGETLRSDAARLEALEGDLEAARAQRTEADVLAKRVGRAAEGSERLLADADAAEREAMRLDREAAAARADADAVVVEAAALAAADTVDAIGEDLSGFREQLVSLASGEARLAAMEVRLRSAVADTGWSVEAALAAASDAGAAAEIEAARERIRTAAVRVDLAVTSRDAAQSGGAGAAPRERGAARPWAVPGFAMAGVGVAACVAGLLVSQTAIAVLGAVMIAVGSGLGLWVRREAPGAAGQSGTRVASADAELAAARQALAVAREEWGTWVRAHGFGEGAEDPAAVAARYQAARTARTTDAERSELAASLEGARGVACAYARRVGEVVAPLLGESCDAATLERSAEFVTRGRLLVAGARSAAAQRRESSAKAERLDRDAAVSRTRGAAAAEEARATLQGAGAGTMDEARSLAIEADGAAKDSSNRFEHMLEEVTALRSRLGSERRDTALAERRLVEETLSERIAAGVSDYAVMSVACRLLALAQERFERERKGPIVECAEAALSSMTGGRYGRIAVPMGKDAIEVFSESSAAIAPEDLSRGTAEQVYLALRLGLIEQSGGVGADLPVLMDDVLVNFSPERAEQAARAIVDLATRRQVVFFTCHPGTAELLCGVAPDAVRLELPPPS